MARYFKTIETKIAMTKRQEEERGLNEQCECGGTDEEHDWLMYPHEKGQKQYLLCMKCNIISHL
jgi:hypothetical protein